MDIPLDPSQPLRTKPEATGSESVATVTDSHAVPMTAPTEGPGAVISHYKLLQKIGEGGFGVVYMAEQTEPVRRRVALKVIKLGMDTKAVIARFEAERQALALMDHPNIAKVLDAGATATGRPYFVMELVKGIRITDYCDQNNLSTTERLGLFMQVCHAIQHAHQKGIIHRDIKPSNILVTLHDGVPVPKVIDFGIAKATTDQRLTDKTLFTAFEQFLGTPAYMSPEQAEMSGLDIDTRSDIYSLGVLLYELLAGSTPFDAKELLASGLDAMRKTIREKEPVRPSTRFATLKDEELTTTAKHRSTDTAKLLHQLRGDLDWIVMKALEKDRTRRYETTNGLAQDIQRHLNNELVAARPPSAAYKLQKFARRNQTAFAAATVVVLALLLGVIVSTWQAVVANRAKTAEKGQRLAAQTERDKAVAAQKEAERAQGAEKEARLRADTERDAAAHNLYVANMSLAQQAWDENNIGRLRQVLDDTKDSPHRGFEWYYWQQQTHLALKTLRGHLSDVSSVAYSPDGQRIVTGSLDRTAKVWEAASGRELMTLKGHMDYVRCVAYSPDGQRIATGSGDETVKVWTVAGGREVLTLKGHISPIQSVVFSMDSQRIVTGSFEGMVKVWEAASGRELLAFKMHSHYLYSVALSPDGQRIATACGDEDTVKILETSSGRELLSLNGHSGVVSFVTFSPDGQRILTCSSDMTATVWEAASGRELFKIKGYSELLSSAAFSPDSQRIVTGSWDRTAKVWEAGTGRELLTLRGHSGEVRSVAFSPDGQRIVTGSGDKTAKVWEAASGLSADDTGGNRLTLTGYTNECSSVAFSRDGRRIVTGGSEGVMVWEAASGREPLMLKGHSDGVTSVAFSPDSQRIVTGGVDKRAKVWEAASGRELLTLKGHSGWIFSVTFSPDGQRIVTGSGDKTAKVWEAANGRELLTLKGHSGWVSSVAFSPDGHRIVTGSGDKTAKVWEAASGRELLTLRGHSGEVRSVAFSPDGQRIVTGSGDKTAKLWEVASGLEVFALEGHSDGVSSVAFSPDGRRVATSSTDKTTKVWEMASGWELLTLKGHSDMVSAVAFSPDGHRIVTCGGDGAREWEAARAEQTAVWRDEERTAAQSIAVLRRELLAEVERQKFAQDRDSIKQWLILGPIALASGQSGEEGLDIEQIEGEGRLRPKAGEARSIGGGELKWREVALEDPVIDFNLIFGQETTQSVAYAVSYLRSEAEQRGLQIQVGGEDTGAKIYLNDKEVYKARAARPINVETQHYVPDIALNAGLNVLVFKLVKETGGWEGSICFTDAQGNPVKGITVTLDPEAKEKASLKQP